MRITRRRRGGARRRDGFVADRLLRLSEASVPVLIVAVLQKDNHGGQDNPEEGLSPTKPLETTPPLQGDFSKHPKCYPSVGSASTGAGVAKSFGRISCMTIDTIINESPVVLYHMPFQNRATPAAPIRQRSNVVRMRRK